MSLPEKLLSGVLKLVNFLIILLITTMTIVVFIAVICRYALRSAIPWAEEFSRYAMIWFAMLGAAVALKENGHVGVSVIVDLFPDKIRRGILQFGRLFVIIFLGFVFVYSIIHIIGMQGQTSPALEMPMGVPYAGITAGSLLMMLISIRQFFGIDKVKSENEATLDDIKQEFNLGQ